MMFTSNIKMGNDVISCVTFFFICLEATGMKDETKKKKHKTE